MTSDASGNAPHLDPNAIEAGRKLFRAETLFLLGAAQESQLPDTDMPEVAFAGRSNVGKSSLINALLGQKAMARTSSTPGRTREVNFFDVGGRLMVADLPGYGYAKAPKTEQKRWTQLIDDYLKGRRPLVRVLILVDARHGLKPSDIALMKTLDTTGVSYQVVLTKADKLKEKEQSAVVAKTALELATHVAAYPFLHLCSSHKGSGIETLRADIGRIAGN